jgi:hypothetical protein
MVKLLKARQRFEILMVVIVKITIFWECDAVEFGVNELELFQTAQEGNRILLQSVYFLTDIESYSRSQKISQS